MSVESSGLFRLGPRSRLSLEVRLGQMTTLEPCPGRRESESRGIGTVRDRDGTQDRPLLGIY